MTDLEAARREYPNDDQTAAQMLRSEIDQLNAQMLPLALDDPKRKLLTGQVERREQLLSYVIYV